MKIEFITDGDIYTKYESIIPKDKNQFKISSNNQKIKGVNNYLLCVEIDGKTIGCAKILSDIREKIKNKLIIDHNKYFLLTDEPTKVYLRKLYPLVCEFETKLRKLVYLALFDLDEPAQKMVLNKIKNTSEFKKIKEIPNSNFLEKLTLGEMFSFLFENSDFLQKANQSIGEQLSKRFKNSSKADIISLIEGIEETTIWKKLFSENFEDSILTNHYEEVFTLRNAVMHFHCITYNEYKNAICLLNKLNKDLDIQLSKGIVLENNSQNLTVVSNNSQYMLSALVSILMDASFIIPTISAGLNTYKEFLNTLKTTNQSKLETNLSGLINLIQYLFSDSVNADNTIESSNEELTK